MKRSSSLRLIDWPMPPARSSTSDTKTSSDSGWCLGGGGPHAFGGPLHGLDDVHVAGAAAYVSRQCCADVFLRRRRVFVQELLRDEHHGRRTEPTLEAVALLEALLNRVELSVRGESLD